MTFTFAASVAWDPNGNKPVKNVSFQAYAVSDTGFTTPLAITDTFGNPIAGNILNSGSQGVFPQFNQATNSAVVITDPTHTYSWTINCVTTDAATANFINTGGSATNSALANTYTPKWLANTAYAVNQIIVNPTGDLVRCTTAHTSASSYDSTKFTLNATDANGATAAALTATYGRKQGAIEFSDDYSTKANGTPPAALTGQAYSLYSATSPNGMPSISGGYLTYADTDYLGGYSTIPLENGVIKFGASFAFTSWSTGGGLACIAAMEEDIKVTQGAGQGVPRSPFHLTIAPDSWGVDVFITKGSSPTRVIGGLFNPNLVADGTTLHRAEVTLDNTNKTAYLTLPNGERHTASHSAMGVAAPFVFIEPYRDSTTNLSIKTKAKFRSFWADSRNTQPLAQAKALAKIPAGPIAVENMPATQSDMALTTTASAVAGVSASYIVPDSGTVIVAVEGLLDQTAAGPVYFGIFDETNALVAVRTVSTKITNGRFSLRMPLSTGTPGAAKTAKMVAYLGGTAAATLLLGNYGTPAIYAGASIMVTPT